MTEITLQSVPNQSFSIDVGDLSYDINIKTGDSTFADVSINGTVIIQGVRVMPYRPIIPYEYLTGGNGNFLFITENGDNINYENFGVNQSLVYMTREELEFLNVY